MTDIFGTMNILELDGCPIHYWQSGSKHNPLLVLTHGAQGDHTMFEAQVEALSQHFCVLTWDLRGHGQSQPLQGALSYRGVAHDILVLLDRLEVERAVLIGHSLGGCASQEMAFLYPERVAGMALIGCPCITEPCHQTITRSQKTLYAISRLLPDKILNQFMMGAADSFSITPEVRTYIREITQKISKSTFLAISQAVLQGFHAEPGYQISQPFLLLHGDHDMAVIQQVSAIWAKREPNCRYAVIPNAGHNAHQDNAMAFNDHLMRFLEEYDLVNMSG